MTFHVVLPDARAFTHLDLQSLAEADNPVPGANGFKIQADKLNPVYVFDAVGQYFEDEQNNNAFSFDFYLPNSKLDHKKTETVLAKMATGPDRWTITIAHKGKSFNIPLSVQGARQYLKANLPGSK